VHLSAGEPLPALVEAVRAAGPAWIVWDEVNDFLREVIAEQALAEAGRRSRVILDGVGLLTNLLWVTFHGLCEPLSTSRKELGSAKYPGRLAALSGSEPEAIVLLKILLQKGDEERALEQIMRDAEDPGAAIARRLGAEGFIGAFQHDFFEGSPPMIRAFGREKLRAAARGRVLWRGLRHDPKQMASHVVAAMRDAALHGELVKGEWLARRAARIAEQGLGPASREHAEALQRLASVEARHGRFKEAESLLRKALEIVEQMDDGLSDTLRALADVLIRQGRYAEAEDIALRALKEARATDTDDARVAEVLALLETLRSLRARSSGGGEPG
jgi:tetratricopeptide (TPR) repeat protein